jgi:hypothetical protein
LARAVSVAQSLRRSGLIIWRTFALMILLMGLGFTLLAVVGWLQTAQWKPTTVSEVLSSFGLREWVAHPRSWLGLHRVVSRGLRVPVFLLLTLIGIGMAVISAPQKPQEIWQPWSGR